MRYQQEERTEPHHTCTNGNGLLADRRLYRLLSRPSIYVLYCVCRFYSWPCSNRSPFRYMTTKTTPPYTLGRGGFCLFANFRRHRRRRSAFCTIPKEKTHGNEKPVTARLRGKEMHMCDGQYFSLKICKRY